MTRLSQIPIETAVHVKEFGEPLTLAKELAQNLTGHQFIAYDARFNIGDERDGKGALKYIKGGKKDSPLPGIVKFTRAQLTVNFDYQAKVEKRDGEFSGRGSWHTVVMVNGKISPLSVHKGDVVLDDNKAQVLDSEGNTQFTTPNPRLYLRYEIVRAHGDEPRANRNMRSKSVYVDAEGNEVDKSLVEPHLKSRGPRKDETDFQLTALDNILELRAGHVVYRKRHMMALPAAITVS